MKFNSSRKHAFRIANFEQTANLERCCCVNCLTDCLVTDSTNVQQRMYRL